MWYQVKSNFLFIFCILCGLTLGCSDDKQIPLQPKQESDYKIYGTRSEFEAAISRLEPSEVFNSKGIVGIDKWILRMNVADSSVLVLEASHKERLYSKLLSGEEDKHIYRFSFKDKVLDLLEDGNYTTSASNARLELGSGGKLVLCRLIAPFGKGFNNTALGTCYNAYVSYGLYAELQVQFESSNPLQGTFDANYKIKTPCAYYFYQYFNKSGVMFQTTYQPTLAYNYYGNKPYVFRDVIWRGERGLYETHHQGIFKIGGVSYSAMTFYSKNFD